MGNRRSLRPPFRLDRRVDFVIPVKCNNLIIRTVVECIDKWYAPRTIFLITDEASIKEIRSHSKHWNIVHCSIVFIDEEFFFFRNYQLTKSDIQKWYTYKDSQSREFGWWYQQLLKLGAVHQIEGLSDPFIVWDADLISLQKWDIFPTLSCPHYRFAILQEKALSAFNTEQYSASIFDLLGEKGVELERGTFVPHHFVMHHHVVNHLLSFITPSSSPSSPSNSSSSLSSISSSLSPSFSSSSSSSSVSSVLSLSSSLTSVSPPSSWIERIMRLSATFYRFSEYKCMATFMHMKYPHLLVYHEFETFGSSGIRYRDCQEILPRILTQCHVPEHGLSFQEFKKFITLSQRTRSCPFPSYIQIEHISYLSYLAIKTL